MEIGHRCIMFSYYIDRNQILFEVGFAILTLQRETTALITCVETEQLVWTDLRSTLVNVPLNTKDVSAKVNIQILVTQKD